MNQVGIFFPKAKVQKPSRTPHMVHEKNEERAKRKSLQLHKAREVQQEMVPQ